MFSPRALRVATALLTLALGPPTVCHADDERQSLEELRNTVINLLQALVDKGLLTREQAQQLVRQAQDKAAADAAAAAANANATQAANAEEEKNAVRVPYVPQIVKDEISKQVAQEVQPSIVADVLQQAKKDGWGVPGGLPEWLARVRVFGDVTLRGQANMFPKDNSFDQILDYNTINQNGGIGKTALPFLDTTENQYYPRVRARLGVQATLSPNWSAAIRLASGSLTDPSSESQTFGTYGARYTVGIDQAYIRYDSHPPGDVSWLSVVGGRIINPWFAPTELVYARDLTFEGAAATARWAFGRWGGADRSLVYLTAGAFPMLQVPLDTHVYWIARHLRLTRRASRNWPTVVEITDALRRVDPDDPVRFDFVLAHTGISGDCPKRKDIAICGRCLVRPDCDLWRRERVRFHVPSRDVGSTPGDGRVRAERTRSARS